MEAGRELDALIAEKVFGAKPMFDRDKYPWAPGTAPHYSTDIAAAWEVVEKLKTRNVSSSESSGIDIGEMPFVLRFTQNNTWEAGWELNYYTSGILEEAETAPLAICLAALKAVGATP